MLTRNSNFGGELVTIDVGIDVKQAFHIHKGLLISESPYFKAAFEGEFCEAIEKRIHIADISPARFQDFMDWLYFRKLPGGCDYLQCNDGAEAPTDDEELEKTTKNAVFIVEVNVANRSMLTRTVKRSFRNLSESLRKRWKSWKNESREMTVG